MNAAELIKNQLKTKKIGDRLPISGWFHIPLVDQNTDAFVEESIKLTDDFQWDFIKVMSNGYYMTAAYGADITYSTDAEEWAGTIHTYPIKETVDLLNLSVLDKTNPILARELTNTERLVKHYQGERPVLATLFNPITWIQEMSGSGDPTFVQHLMANHKKELHKGIETLLATNFNFLDELYKVGIDGVFLASQFASSDLLTTEQYREFVLPYDQELLKHLKKNTWFNMMHLHGDRHLLFDEVVDYDVQALNWENTPVHAPKDQITSIADVRQKTDKLIIAGVDQDHDFIGSEAEAKEIIRKRLHQALEENQGGSFIFAPGCGLSLKVERERYKLFHEVAAEEGLR